jgi:hypothetical protein
MSSKLSKQFSADFKESLDPKPSSPENKTDLAKAYDTRNSFP